MSEKQRWTVKWRRLTALAIFACVACLPGIASAQGSAISGTVSDSTRGVLPGVTVEARTPTSIEEVRTAVTDGAGNYAIVSLETGTYEVTFALPGFNTVVREGIELSSGFTATVDIELRVGDVGETITVTGASPIVDVQNVQRLQVMDREVIDSIPTGKSITGYGLLVPGMSGAESWGTPLAQDSGGMSVQSRQRMSIHGGNHEDQQLELNGLDVGDAFSQGANLGFFPDTNMEEMVFSFSGNTPDTETGGVRINMLPKEGGNTFSGMLFTTFTHANLQANNLDQPQIDAGLRDPTVVDQVWSINPNIGGPIVQDKLWFFAAHTTQRAFILPTGSYWDSTPSTTLFTPDYNDRVLDTATAKEQSFNITWQVNSRNKVKLYWSNSSTVQDVYLQGRTLQSFFVAPEASIDSDIETNTYQATWVFPATNRLLFEAGASHHPIGWTFASVDRANLNVPGAIHVGPTMAVHNMAGWLGGATHRASPKQVDSYRASASYVTGSHSFKFGMTALRQWTGTFQQGNQNPPWTSQIFLAAFNSPIRVTYYGTSEQQEEAVGWGLYAQDQWTLDRLTVNLGVRLDRASAGYPDEVRPANENVLLPFNIEAATAVTWNDIQPRVGLVYDLFGDARTALKFSINRYGKRDSVDWAQRVNPAVVNRAQNRSWYDGGNPFGIPGLPACIGTTITCIAGDGIPQGDPTNPAPNGELVNANTNLAFGQPRIVRFYDPEWAFGWGQRAANWETALSIQHER